MYSLIPVAVAILIEALKDKKDSLKYADAIAKVYVKLTDAVSFSPVLTAAVERQRGKS